MVGLEWRSVVGLTTNTGVCVVTNCLTIGMITPRVPRWYPEAICSMVSSYPCRTSTESPSRPAKP